MGQQWVDKTIAEIPECFVLKQLLLEHKAEVKGMILTEYNEEEIMNGFKEEAMEEGIKKGIISTLTALVADNLFYRFTRHPSVRMYQRTNLLS